MCSGNCNCKGCSNATGNSNYSVNEIKAVVSQYIPASSDKEANNNFAITMAFLESKKLKPTEQNIKNNLDAIKKVITNPDSFVSTNSDLESAQSDQWKFTGLLIGSMIMIVIIIRVM